MVKKDEKITLADLIVVIYMSLAFFLIPGCAKEQKSGDLSQPAVQVYEVIQQDVPVYAEWIGTTDGMVNAIIRAQVQGYLIKQNYHEGDFVRKGQILFEIDPRTFRAALDQAKGQLGEQTARWQTAKANLTRIIPLAEQNAVSKKDLDDAIGQEKAAHAAVISAEAFVEKARLDLDFTKIVSPVDGIAGIAKTQIGNLVGPGVTEELTTVSTVDPIKVYISVSEQEYLIGTGKGKNGFKGNSLEMVLSDGSVYSHKGNFTLADRQVDVKTGTIRVAAVFKNPGNILRPGQFAKVRAIIKVKSALLVPQRAVMELQGSYRVAVVDAGNRVDIRPVKVAERINSLWVVDEGLKAGERVIAEGVQKVRQGIVVNPVRYVAEQPGAEQTQKAEGLPAAESTATKR
ncbi:MAG TPA: efflux RND transporter periplasmic adaptor subunit [Syntrophales bacterium]|nr:efflux RND transporter periplasmic adaptor subunit [Syntrophales bacterium]